MVSGGANRYYTLLKGDLEVVAAKGNLIIPRRNSATGCSFMSYPGRIIIIITVVITVINSISITVVILLLLLLLLSVLLLLSDGVYTYITHFVVSKSITWLTNLLLT